MFKCLYVSSRNEVYGDKINLCSVNKYGVTMEYANTRKLAFHLVKTFRGSRVFFGRIYIMACIIVSCLMDLLVSV
jgi:hypothetical protein